MAEVYVTKKPSRRVCVSEVVQPLSLQIEDTLVIGSSCRIGMPFKTVLKFVAFMLRGAVILHISHGLPDITVDQRNRKSHS